jgi:23S rRNA pseudouridine1911/1915/1917 synthase
VACRILTGRTHQIRVHLKECLRCPIAGDALYGKKGGRGAARLMLHAWQLGFTHPVSGEEMSFRSPIPPEFHPWTSRVAGLEALAGEDGWEFPLP